MVGPPNGAENCENEGTRNVYVYVAWTCTPQEGAVATKFAAVAL
jgi:hypothetical protein